VTLTQLNHNSIQSRIPQFHVPTKYKEIFQKNNVKTPVKMLKSIFGIGDFGLYPQLNPKEEDLPWHVCTKHEIHNLNNKGLMSKNVIKNSHK
jgi:hypothetical protein